MFTEKQIKNFFSRTLPQESGCIHYTGKSRNNGYPQVHIRLKDGQNLQSYAHRISWMIVYGKIENNLYVLHKCDNPLCCNINHLFLGTHQDNMDDMVRKGRAKDGAKKRDYVALQAMAQSEESRKKRIETFQKIGHQRGEKNSQHGTHWITNGSENMRWRDSNAQMPEGFRRGRVQKNLHLVPLC